MPNAVLEIKESKKISKYSQNVRESPVRINSIWNSLAWRYLSKLMNLLTARNSEGCSSRVIDQGRNERKIKSTVRKPKTGGIRRS